MKRTFAVVALMFCTYALLAEDTVGTHVVKAGETLQGITAHYLGTSRAWQENWKLNPNVRDPNKLVPGQKLRVIIARTLPAQSALIRSVSNHVERKPEPQPWTTAAAGDRLAERHGVHTFATASAELRFDDDTTLTLTEQSLVFLRAAAPAPSVRERSAIEIVDGHADLEKPAQAKKPLDIEIVVGSTTAAAKDPGAKARFRSEAKKAQVMSYRGATSVASAGAEVSVGAGMGVTVPDGEKPPAPEKLLGAPAVAAMDFASARPRLHWPALGGAKSYAVEICRDRGCADLLARAASVSGTEWRSDVPLEAGSYFWRVTAKSVSGLDGYPAVAALTVRRGISGSVTSDGRGAEGASVTLNRGDSPVATVRTNAAGDYEFRDLDSGDYSVAVDARSVDTRGWAADVSPVAGARRVTLGASPVDSIDFAFSMNAVTNANDAGQGSLRQFLENANAIPGPNAMQYLGPVATVKLASPLPRITDVTTIAGRETQEEIGSVTSVGSDETMLHNPSRSALTIDFAGAPVGIDATADLTLHDVMLQGAAINVRSAAGLTMDGVVIGELLERRDATGVEANGHVLARRTLITGMKRTGMAVKGTLDAEHLEISWSGEGLRIDSPGSRIRHSLFLLNDNGATLPANTSLESTTFRGNRKDGVAASEGNVFEALTAR
jgi:hypothetical protein